MTTQNRMLMAGMKYEGAAPGANTNIFSTSLQPTETASTFRIGVCLATGSVFKMVVTDGTTANTITFNGGGALTASCGYTFTWPVRKYSTGTTALSYNFQVATDGVIDWLSVEEVPGGLI